MTCQAFADAGIVDPLFTVAFGHQHVDDLPAPADQLAQQASCFVGDRTWLRLHRFGKAGDHLGVDRIGLGPLADRSCEVAHLRRVHHHERQRGAGNCRRHRR